MFYEQWQNNPPGMVLGPYEALLAIIAWMREELPQNKYPGDTSKLTVSHQMKEQLLIANLLYGKFDAVNAMGFFGSYLAGKGFFESRRELVGDFLLRAPSPFCHSLEEGWGWPIFQSQPELDSMDEKALVSACYKAMNRAGIKGYTPFGAVKSIPLRLRLKEAMNSITYCQNNQLNPALLAAESAIISLIYSIGRSVDLGVPFYSCNAAAPAWIRQDLNAESCIVRIIFDEVDWLPHPRTFREAASMAQDERLFGLRAYVNSLTERAMLGDFDLQESLRAQIREDIKSFRDKTWASKVAKFIAYAAVPIEIAGVLCNAHLVGVSVASVGAACEWISSKCAKRKNKHWLSMVKLPQYIN